jgi:hypothetical protein
VRRIRGGLLTGACVLGLAGCGSSAPAPELSAPPSARTLLSQSAAALDQVHSFHLQGIEQDAGAPPAAVSADFSIPGRVALSISQAGHDVSLRLVGGQVYLRGNAQYWVGLGVGAQQLPALTGRWIHAPRAAARALAPLLALASRRTLGRCTTESGHDTISLGGGATVDGMPVLVLVDHGDAPGGAPGRLFVGPGALPVLITQSGPRRPGGGPDRACGATAGSKDTTASSSLRFSRYNRPVRITAPADALDATGLKAWASTSAPAQPRPARGAPSRSLQSAQAAEMIGGWHASGKVLASRGFTNEPLGAVLTRVWRIVRTCRAGVCRLYFARSTVSAPIIAPLVWAGGHWTADFVENDPCSNGGTSLQYSHWTIEVRPGALSAGERSHTTSCGPSATNEIQWRAEPVLAAPGSASQA